MKKICFLILIGILCASCKDKEDITFFEFVVTTSVVNFTDTSATCEGYVWLSKESSNSIIESGICYAIKEKPDINDSIKVGDYTVGTYTVELTGLQPNTLYYVRAYTKVVKEKDTVTCYGNEIRFTTLRETSPLNVKVETESAMADSDTTAICIGFVRILQGSTDDIAESGICYLIKGKTEGEPTIEDFINSKPEDRKSTDKKVGKYTVELTGLQSDTTYYVRAYTKTYSSGFFYSENHKSFKTDTSTKK